VHDQTMIVIDACMYIAFNADPACICLEKASTSLFANQANGAGRSEEFKQVMEALLEPINKVCLEKLSRTRCASEINRDDLQDVRKAFRTILQVKDADNDAFVKEEFW